MNKSEVFQHFRDAGALLEGHFLLSSGLHSPVYLQCARVLMDASRAGILCAELARQVRRNVTERIDLVVSPAMGGVIVGYEMGRQLDLPSIFAERVDGAFTLRRGFEIPQGARVLMVEDVVTTGLSSRECIDCIHQYGGKTVAAACLIDRSNGQADVGVPLYALACLDIPAYREQEVPPELSALPAVKPGSRGLR